MKTLEDLERDAGEELVKIILALIKEEEAADWFYNTKAPGLNGKTAYEYCKEGKKSELEKMLKDTLYSGMGA